jgi:hypothetical protein
MFGPPELVHVDMKETDIPCIVFQKIGQGSFVWIPWELGKLYYRQSLPAHAALFHDVMDRLNSNRQVLTDAHPLVEMTLMRQGGRTLLHLINLSGHSQTAYYPPIPMTGIRVQLAGTFKNATSVRNPAHLPIRILDGRSEFEVPALTDYELIVLE